MSASAPAPMGKQKPAMFRYNFGGLHLCSDIALPDLVDAGADTAALPALTLTAVAGSAIEPDKVWYRWQQGYRLEIGERGPHWLFRSKFPGQFVVDRDGAALRMITPDLPPPAAAIEVLQRRVLPRVAMLRGAIMVHAASLAHAGRGIMLIGRSGAGKSTLCGSLALQPDWQMLGDDAALLWHPDAPMLGGGAKAVCLWPESQQGLQLDATAGEALASATGKRRAPIVGADPPALVPLAAMIFLERGGAGFAPRLEPLSLVDFSRLIVPQIMLFNPHGDFAQQRIDALVGLVRAAQARPAWRLVYPSDFAALPDVAALLRAAMARDARDCARAAS